MIGSLQWLDEWLFRLINRTLANPIGDFIFPAFNQAAPFLPVFVLALAWLAYRNAPRLWVIALGLILAVILGDALVFNPLKQWIARPRPAASLVEVRTLASGATGGYAFPSSHTANAFVAAAVLSYFFPRKRRAFLAIASIIGLARVYVGVHYPSDIMGSALLGWLFGQIFLQMARAIWRKIPFASGSVLLPESNGIAPFPFKSSKALASIWAPVLLLVGIQAWRLLWAATTSLDVPPLSLRLFFLTTEPHSWMLIWPAKVWFGIFGSSPLSLWAIPWFLQCLWLGTLAWAAWRRGKILGLWGLVILSALIPLVSQLSFLGSPETIFESSDWNASRPVQAGLWYFILGLPLWIAALFQWRRHFIGSLLTLGGWIFASSLPFFPWQICAWAASGTLLILAADIGKLLASASRNEFARQRFAFALLLVYGLTLSAAVYNPRFLRKLDISLLPRNNPQYVQTGWREWTSRIQPILIDSNCREIWTDSSASRDQVQYWIGPRFRVRDLDHIPSPPTPLSPGIFYIREVDLAQINPRVIFLQRRGEILSNSRLQVKELASTEIFRKGDPIRQLQLYFVTAF